MDNTYLGRLKEFASIDIIPTIIQLVRYKCINMPEYFEMINELEMLFKDGSDRSILQVKDAADAYYHFKYSNFRIRIFFIMVEIDAYYNMNSLFNILTKFNIPQEDKVGIKGIFDTLQALPDYFYLYLIKSIDKNNYYQEDLIDCIVQNKKEEFVEIIRRERYDIDALANVCSIYKKIIDNIEKIKSGCFATIPEEDINKKYIKEKANILNNIDEKSAQKYNNDVNLIILEASFLMLRVFWGTQDKYTTTEKNILESVINDITDTPQYIEQYNKYHKDGIFYPDGVEDTNIEEAEVEEVITDSLPESSKEPINTSKKYEEDVPLYCQSKNRSGEEPLKLDKYYANDRSRVMTLLEAMAEKELIWEGEINSFYTHFTGFGNPDNLSAKLHWRGGITELSFLIVWLYPYECNDAIRFEPIKVYVEYKHEAETYNNGTNFASAATRPNADFKRLLRRLYSKESERPRKYDKIK